MVGGNREASCRSWVSYTSCFLSLLPKCSEALSRHVHDSTEITSLSLSAFKQCKMHKLVPQGGVTEFWTRYMCLFLTQLSCCCVQPLQQACCSTWAPIMPHKSAKFTLMLHIAAQTSSTPCYSNPTGQAWTQQPRENVQVEAAQATQGAHGQACRDGIRKINV